MGRHSRHQYGRLIGAATALMRRELIINANEEASQQQQHKEGRFCPPDLKFSHTAPRRDRQFKSLTGTAAAAKEKRSCSGVQERQESAVEDSRCALYLPTAV